METKELSEEISTKRKRSQSDIDSLNKDNLKRSRGLQDQDSSVSNDLYSGKNNEKETQNQDNDIYKTAKIESEDEIESNDKEEETQRGYMAKFNWTHYLGNIYRVDDGVILPSIPGLFQYILSILQEVERETNDKEILNLLDKKILRPRIATDRTDKGFTLICPQTNDEYFVIANRREQVKLIYDGILNKLGICNHLIDIFLVSPGTGPKMQCIAGSQSTDSYYKNMVCTCQESKTKDIDENETSDEDNYEFLRIQGPPELWNEASRAIMTARHRYDDFWKNQMKEMHKRLNRSKKQIRDMEIKLQISERKAKQEADVNKTLWERIQIIQKQLQRMNTAKK